MANLIVLYGPSQSGKTTYLTGLVDYYKSVGLEVKGVLSPAVYHNEKKVGIKVRDANSGVEKYLAASRLVELPHKPNRLGFIFDDDAVRWGNDVLKASLPTDVFIVDEIGPLEFKQHKGWRSAIGQIMLQQYKMCIVVLRESLHDQVKDIWPVTEWVKYQRDLSVTVFDHYFYQ